VKIPLPCLVAVLAGCVYVPRTTTVYDSGCQVTSHHMELELTQVASFGHCGNQGCLALLVASGVVTAASAVVSGSVVVTGNVVYWFERQGDCAR
jgi:hypothetical protein